MDIELCKKEFFLLDEELEERLAYLIDKPFLTKEEHDEMVKIGNELPKSPPTTLSFNIRLDKMAK